MRDVGKKLKLHHINFMKLLGFYPLDYQLVFQFFPSEKKQDDQVHDQADDQRAHVDSRFSGVDAPQTDWTESKPAHERIGPR